MSDNPKSVSNLTKTTKTDSGYLSIVISVVFSLLSIAFVAWASCFFFMKPASASTNYLYVNSTYQANLSFNIFAQEFIVTTATSVNAILLPYSLENGYVTLWEMTLDGNTLSGVENDLLTPSDDGNFISAFPCTASTTLGYSTVCEAMDYITLSAGTYTFLVQYYDPATTSAYIVLPISQDTDVMAGNSCWWQYKYDGVNNRVSCSYVGTWGFSNQADLNAAVVYDPDLGLWDYPDLPLSPISTGTPFADYLVGYDDVVYCCTDCGWTCKISLDYGSGIINPNYDTHAILYPSALHSGYIVDRVLLPDPEDVMMTPRIWLTPYQRTEDFTDQYNIAIEWSSLDYGPITTIWRTSSTLAYLGHLYGENYGQPDRESTDGNWGIFESVKKLFPLSLYFQIDSIINNTENATSTKINVTLNDLSPLVPISDAPVLNEDLINQVPLWQSKFYPAMEWLINIFTAIIIIFILYPSRSD